MARIEDLPPEFAAHLLNLPCEDMGETPCVAGPPPSRRRVAIISTAGLGRKSDAGFGVGDGDYRVIPADLPPGELTMSHISVNYDRTGFQEDVNIVFPIDRLRELAAAGEIGSVADFHYSFMGASDPKLMQPAVESLIGPLKADGVDAVVLIPV
ncbi:MAG: selenoprotein B glycine/betaine/sarcosine/D-proline reductase [Alphaproteobacteria bacterium]|nr:selenoprotein B glycine/betaine/sarcosine/D-proline reductase [Alphaproteobacteria bacterium]MCB9929298.1 selenoprotein B glycine/betaine/sarcosine/D-proline reductase [Alphaproteobacteria bacterium]